MDMALELARKADDQGEMPISAVLTGDTGQVVAFNSGEIP
jgi:tRNA(Arg) A34 adenosine deaminase TadA